MTLTYNTQGYREIAPGQPHSRTEYRTDDGRTISMPGTGEATRTALIEHVEGKQ